MYILILSKYAMDLQSFKSWTVQTALLFPDSIHLVSSSISARFRLGLFRDESWQKLEPLTTTIQTHLTTTTEEDARSSPIIVLFAFNVIFNLLRRLLL